VKYPAASVNVLKPAKIDFMDWTDYLNNHVGPFVQSINTGVNEAVDYAEWAQQTCHSSKIIMVGYSQGAMVMHDAEIQLETKDRAAFNLIIGTVLVADGNRLPNTKAKEFGSSPASGEGLEPWIFGQAFGAQPSQQGVCPPGEASITGGQIVVP
jgi:Cutinase